ncbi:MAG TPA: hypothetical protein VN704_12170, partial [Verrucomicrobiae bacterium]|nr:hypothetical protein [Verrucomicrobiae bacterium]
MTKERAISEIITYSKEIKKIIEYQKQNNEPLEKTFQRRKYLQFEYDGRRITSSRHQELKIKNWDHLIYPVIWQCRDSHRINEVESFLKRELPGYAGGYLLSYVSTLVHLLFQNKTKGMYSINNLARAFVKHALNEKLKYKLTLELEGIVLPSKKIKLNKNLIISRVHKSDLERKIPIEYFENYLHATEKATTKFELNYEDDGETIEFDIAERYLIPLRLFKLGNVQRVSIKRETENIESYTSLDEVGSYDRVFVGLSYLLKSSEIKRLQKFYKSIIKKVSFDVFLPWLQKESIAIAYSRYIESLARRGSIERMLAYAVMGLEALLLEGDEEINYRLRMRSARILQILSLDGKSVFDDLFWAYKARSAYAHG